MPNAHSSASPHHSLPSIVVAGATGAVGREMLAILEQRRFPHSSIKALASPKSAGQKLPYRGGMLTVEALTAESLRGVDIALFSAGSSISKDFCRVAAEHGCTTVDNSSAFRMVEGVPLTVPEVNPESLGDRKVRTADGKGRIIANPNCSTIILLMALTPLRNAFGVERIVVSTYQAASGAGAKGMEELEQQTRADLASGERGAAGGRAAGGDARPTQLKQEVFHEPYAFNLFSHNTAIDAVTGLNVEETKVILETRKIWNDPAVAISATCVRVPVRRAHAESVNVTLKRAATTEQVREALSKFPGVQVIDDRAGNRFPTPLKASGKDDVLVGRIRPDSSRLPAGAGAAEYARPCLSFDLFVCGDQLRKGAALNAVQIAEMLRI